MSGAPVVLHMCDHLDGLQLQIMTNSLPVVASLFSQPTTRLVLAGGALVPESGIILPYSDDDAGPRFHAPKLFIGPSSFGRSGALQVDAALFTSDRRLCRLAQQIIVLADSSDIADRPESAVCRLEQVDTLVTDSGISPAWQAEIEAAGVRVVVAH